MQEFDVGVLGRASRRLDYAQQVSTRITSAGPRFPLTRMLDYDGYIASSAKMAKAAAAYRATALVSNHLEFDDDFFKAHTTASRQADEAIPSDVGADGVARYFVVQYCAEAAKLRATGR